MSESSAYKIRPAGRHLLTIGRDLIQDNYAAIVELVKNAYDADSPSVNIQFIANDDQTGYEVSIQDYGHGMSRDVVINQWMVPSTKDKLERKVSPKGRTMQGRKGVGRYAASVLGSDLLLETISQDKEKTIVFVEWASFEHADYLDDVEILVESQESTEKSGTLLTITGNAQYLDEWTKKQFEKLRFELKKLISPVDKTIGKDDLEFQINLKISGFVGVDDIDEKIEPYPIIELYDYQISGFINSDGMGELVYSSQKARNTVEETVSINFDGPTNCGDLSFDIRAYDRESEALDSLINRGLKDEYGNYVGKLQARQLLTAFSGIGVYRNGFRIRPLGNADFDWLRLNEQRVQNPSMRIGSNQVIGYVQIQSEEQSNLVEKSARDGLQENMAYEKLKEITKFVIGELETRRFIYRRKADLSKPALKVERELEKLFSFESLKSKVQKKLIDGGMTESAALEVIELIKHEEEEKSKTAEDIRQVVATYQGQATLGKIINVVLHEGRRPLSFFKNEVPRLARFRKKLVETQEQKYIDDIVCITNGVEENANNLSILFKRIDPLAMGKRASRQPLDLRSSILDVFALFRQDMEDSNIHCSIEGDATIFAWKQDIHAIFANLIDNSVFWLKEKSFIRSINVTIVAEGDELQYVDLRDSGPGVEPILIRDGIIFEPQFSTKPTGSGIGLSIAGEAAERNNLELMAFESPDGAYFRLQTRKKNND